MESVDREFAPVNLAPLIKYQRACVAEIAAEYMRVPYPRVEDAYPSEK